MRLAAALFVPVVYLRLQFCALRQQLAIAGGEILKQSGEAAPECFRVAAGGRQHLALDEGGELRIDLEAGAVGVVSHLFVPCLVAAMPHRRR